MTKSGKSKLLREGIEASHPAEQFIDIPEEIITAQDQIEIDRTEEKNGFKPQRQEGEAKSKHIHLTLKPSLFKRLKARADRERLSVNEFIHLALEYVLTK